MRYRWSLPKTPEFPVGVRRPVEQVLIDLDGPELVTARDDVHRYIGLAADRDGDAERWIFAPMSDLELEALCTGGVSMRNAVAKTDVEVIDLVAGQPKAVWRVSPEMIPKGILPAKDADLPEDIGAAALKALLGKTTTARVAPVFRCAGGPVQGSAISFLALAGIAGALQRLWSDIAYAVLPAASTVDAIRDRAEATTLRMADKEAASFGIRLMVGRDKTFQRIAGVYRSLARLTPGLEKNLQSRFAPSVLSAHSAYLHTLEKYDAEVLAELDDRPAYLGASYAARTRPSVRSALKDVSVEEKPRQIVARGFLQGADTKRNTFRFFDTNTDTEIRGVLSRPMARMLKSRAGEFRVGLRTMYDVKIERDSNGKAVLASADETSPNLPRLLLSSKKS